MSAARASGQIHGPEPGKWQISSDFLDYVDTVDVMRDVPGPSESPSNPHSDLMGKELFCLFGTLGS